jgi:hypothetical protein
MKSPSISALVTSSVLPAFFNDELRRKQQVAVVRGSMVLNNEIAVGGGGFSLKIFVGWPLCAE